jgi:radical SAM superfamily enzyme YgiQ (UPF0313 family)
MMKIKKIALVSPPSSLEERYGKFAAAGSTMPSLGLLSLAAVAMRAGVDAKIIEAAAYGLSQDEVTNELASYQPDLVGITATTLSIFHAHETAEAAHQALPGILTVIGGPHVSAVPEETLKRFPHFDLAVLGEGEATLVELMEALSDGKELSAVRGLALRDGNEIVLTGPREKIKDLDSLPFPAWGLLPGFPARFRPAPFRYRQLPAATLVSSRGCPNNCLFCDRTVFGRACRMFSAEYVLDMIGRLHKDYGVRELVFEDDTFVVNKPRVLKICEGLRKSGWGITWSCLGRVDMVSPELLKEMRKAGCWQIGYGVESGDQSILDLVEKKIKLERVRQALAWTKETGMMTKGFFILGFPTETKETMQKTIDFAKSNALDDISVFKLTPLPGSRVYEIAHEYGSFDNDWRKMNLLDAVFVPKDLKKEELDEAARRMMREFYMRPKIFLSYIGRLLRNPSHILPLLKGFLAFRRAVSNS